MKALQQIIRSIPADDNNALIDPDAGPLSYKELTREWHSLHSFFIEQNSTLQTLGIYCKKKSNTIIAIGASLWSDIIYVPLDAYSTAYRNKNIIENASLQALITDDNSLFDDLNLIPIAQKKKGDLYFYILSDQKNETLPEDTAYILHTSGSTGSPKGVIISHENAICFIDWCIQQFEINGIHKMVSIAPFHFDLSVLDLFVTLKTHASLLLLDQPLLANPRIIAEYLFNHKIDVIYATPSFYINLFSFGRLKSDSLCYIKLLLFAGEEFPIIKFNEFKKHIPKAEVYNLYGPTETNVASFAKIKKNENNLLPIGNACPYNEVILINEEIYISGKSLAAGYLNDPILTNQKFILLNEKIWYKTGDFGEYLPTGQLLFKGRKDRMIKRNGYRIELDEIQNVISILSGIDQVAVISKAKNESLKIFAYYSSSRSLNQLVIRKEFLHYLPQYLMPDLFIAIDQLPLTNSGKIDFQGLTNLEPSS